MESASAWVDRFNACARLTLPDSAAVKLAGFEPQGRSVTARLLWCRLTRSVITPTDLDIGSEPDTLMLARSLGHNCAIPNLNEKGPSMLSRSREDVIEIWTERELATVHAASSVREFKATALRSARWLVHEIQPDNATNLPWAGHVFARLWLEEQNLEAKLYAETLIHNCMVSQGKPDELSALILLDSAQQLQAHS